MIDRYHPANHASRGPAPSVSSTFSTGERKAELIPEAAELVLCTPETSAVLCDAFVYEPDAHEKALGSLFFVIETANLEENSNASRSDTDARDGSPTAQHSPARIIIDLVASTMRAEYYRDPARDMLTSFEAALGAANEALARAAENGMTDWLINLHGAVVASRGATLHVSRAGNASLLLVRHGHLTDIGEGLADPNIRNPRATFTNVASGAVSEHDTLVLATPQFFRHVSKDRGASILTGKHPKQAAAYLRDLLMESREEPALAALFVRFVKAPIALPTLPRSPEMPGGIPLSNVAAPSLAGRPTRFARLPDGQARPSLRPPAPLRINRGRGMGNFLRQGAKLVGYLISTRLFPAVGRVFRVGARAARTAAANTARSVPTVLGALARRRRESPALERPGTSTAQASGSRPSIALTERLRAVLRGWPRSTKAFVTLTVLFALLFGISIVMLRRKGVEDAAVRAASETLQEARVKKDTAEATLIYDNTDEARRLLQEARDGALAVQQTPYYQGEAEQLLAAIQAAEDKAENVVRVSEPLRAGDFGSVAPDGRARGLAAIGSSLFAFHPETNAVFRLASETGEATTVSQTSQGIGYFRQVFAIPAEQMLLFATDTPGLALFDVTRGDLLKQEISPAPEGAKEIRALATFGSRLYLLFPELKQIFGYSKTLAGYAGGAPWLKDPKVPVERVVSLGVDGYIYLLLDDGKIVKLLKGVPVAFAQTELGTPLSKDARLFINDAVKHLYVLDPSNQRVVVYDTTGKLTKQYVFPTARDLRDLTIGGKEETLYVLDGTAVYTVPLKEGTGSKETTP
ncbi:MAG: DUF4398 domain-containing protein [bacterium]|nr:DUF4398 domain-containing protein [bacterium]